MSPKTTPSAPMLSASFAPEVPGFDEGVLMKKGKVLSTVRVVQAVSWPQEKQLALSRATRRGKKLSVGVKRPIPRRAFRFQLLAFNFQVQRYHESSELAGGEILHRYCL